MLLVQQLVGEIRSGADCIGKHFLEKHGQGFNLKNEELFEEKCNETLLSHNNRKC